MYRISTVSLVTNDALRITFLDGTDGVVTAERLARAGGVLETLRDARIFKQVSVQGDGRFLQWPGEIEFCADALRQSLCSSSPRSPSDTPLRA